MSTEKKSRFRYARQIYNSKHLFFRLMDSCFKIKTAIFHVSEEFDINIASKDHWCEEGYNVPFNLSI
jgi:hypothetical protein